MQDHYTTLARLESDRDFFTANIDMFDADTVLARLESIDAAIASVIEEIKASV